MNNAMIIEPEDNVAVAIEPIPKGEAACYVLPDGTPCRITVIENITIYHKFAVHDIAKGEKIVKYGEHIGEAGAFIPAGAHVHEHNVISVRENLDDRG
ncbi:UxaA family hydrolase [Massiliimalia massiliensis]|jgi:altronate dehydratase small subunit|uniref:UxaA family hydrolase n=1 Tax=Massiliimalia massiliensis TaxID=1852384 RepID=UPI000986C910|nr:UxaA family hydrolase [Massiliimalia massiliensis]